MKITQEADYAVRIILNLTSFSENERVEANVISENTRVPLRFTLKIMRKLTNGGILKSFRGNNGGYALLKKPSEITLLEVIQIIDGQININKCLGDKSVCSLNSLNYCVVHEELRTVQTRMVQDLENVTFESLANKNKFVVQKES
ncbi:MAG: Rrf2 family transcriptional regulator [bacterium]